MPIYMSFYYNVNPAFSFDSVPVDEVIFKLVINNDRRNTIFSLFTVSQIMIYHNDHMLSHS